MKEKFVAPEAELVAFENDAIATSVPGSHGTKCQGSIQDPGTVETLWGADEWIATFHVLDSCYTEPMW